MARRSLLLRRDYHGYTGGHGKFRDYVAHVDAHPGWVAQLYMDADSRRQAGNPFLDVPGLVDAWQPAQADALLLGGMDWAAVPDGVETRVPVINLVQHVRHAAADSPLRKFLGRRAIRICNSSRVAEALRATGEVNGPLRVIPSAVDTGMLATLTATACMHDVFVDAVKQPVLGQAVAERLRARGLHVHLLLTRLPLPAYLQAMAAATIALPLPDPTEGIYLPGLNAMAIGRALVQPDCVGSREYARDGENALVPPRTAEALAAATWQLHADLDLRERLATAGRSTSAQFDLALERQRVHAVLDQLEELWKL